MVYGRARHRANYLIPPKEYCAETAEIRNGMTAPEVDALLRGVTTVTRWIDSRISFAMKPLREGTSMPYVSYFINIQLDDQGRVLEAESDDG